MVRFFMCVINSVLNIVKRAKRQLVEEITERVSSVLETTERVSFVDETTERVSSVDETTERVICCRDN